MLCLRLYVQRTPLLAGHEVLIAAWTPWCTEATGTGGRWQSPWGKGICAGNTDTTQNVPMALLVTILFNISQGISGFVKCHPKGTGTGLESHCPGPSGRFQPVLQALSATSAPRCPLTPRDLTRLVWKG